MAHTKPKQTKNEGERLKGERYHIKFIELRFERWQVVGLRKARRRQNNDYSSYVKRGKCFPSATI